MGQKIRYVHIDSNHPPTVINAIPKGINQRLNNISANEEIFKEAAKPYQQAIQEAGHNYTLMYEPEIGKSNNKKNKNRKPNILWNNPP